MQRTGVDVVEHWDGDAPGPLATDAPVGTPLHHGCDALLARSRNPLHRPHCIHGRLPEALHRHKPLHTHMQFISLCPFWLPWLCQQQQRLNGDPNHRAPHTLSLTRYTATLLVCCRHGCLFASHLLTHTASSSPSLGEHGACGKMHGNCGTPVGCPRRAAKAARCATLVAQFTWSVARKMVGSLVLQS